jgi:hypothetical protein
VLFLFAKHFFHSTTHHHRSASGLCPGLIGLVSLTPTHILLATHYYILTGGIFTATAAAAHSIFVSPK